MINGSEFEKSAGPDSALAILCSNLSLGLHAVAQPLAILRASLDSTLTDRMAREELRQLTASSALEVERVCTHFNFLQQLVVAESVKPDLSATPLLPLITNVTDGVNLLFDSSGMFLQSLVPNICRPVLINTARTRQALSSVLLVAHTVSSAQDTIELIAAQSPSHSVQIIVRNLNSRVDVMNAEGRLSMALAEALIRSQQGSFSWGLNPFSVQFELQQAPLAH